MSYALEFCAMQTMPAEKAILAPAKIHSPSREIYSIRPTYPPDVQYIGSRESNCGYITDYYEDPKGRIWFESRKKEEPIITRYYTEEESKRRFRKKCKRLDANAHFAEM